MIFLFFLSISIFVLFLTDVILLTYFIDFVTRVDEETVYTKQRIEFPIAKFRFLHVVNPFSTSNQKSNNTQHMSIRSISNAFHYIKENHANQSLPVSIHVLALTDKRFPFLPGNFIERPLPVQAKSAPPTLQAILQEALNYARNKNFTHIIYTNMDINIVPSFYQSVGYLLNCSDTLLINRSLNFALRHLFFLQG